MDNPFSPAPFSTVQDESPPESGYIAFRGEKIKLTRDPVTGFYSDPDRTLYAFADPAMTTDPINRAGVYPFALPTWKFFQKVNDGAAVHDFMYSSPVFQMFHTEEEANQRLADLEAQEGYPVLGAVFKYVTDEVGWKYWENPLTVEP